MLHTLFEVRRIHSVLEDSDSEFDSNGIMPVTMVAILHQSGGLSTPLVPTYYESTVIMSTHL
jgi:hypothetical protein